ncbi:polyhydroxybutyrate depolymerase [Gordonia amarae]|uniref:Polyhydroxybutyrate depolymerase n=1 Tax=Gordonia amarae TaxID=36821 RepID=A0A857KWX8_9ACTN|nr:PHB depolymerase family esterase [Gordonia amarae]MCS3878849.1 polyhydroxybutyrate depolymerase [Gordonia amarae]QHN17412.1 polyhydroxybutyrate depolymerase [Gordonia amarae]QHN21938.1 polyhydroxybutyrate depolymerase [Gordonia amarae]QHN30818.1 polyhydroxybutyrate depolymerase [Gordonia amarae]QHN39564.1 polyhydroxybutyrate depolymerase [Gordonia amarae]
MTRPRFRMLAAVIVIGAIVLGGALIAVERRAPEAHGEPAIKVGTSTHSLTFGGLDRSFRIYRPATAARRAPLVVVLHGGFGSARQAEKAYGWDQQAEAGGFVVAYPDAVRRSWNAGSCCGGAASANLNDVGFVDAVVRTIARLTPIDSRRVYATGMSNGAMLALRIACESTTFAAVAPVAGTLVTACPAPRKMSVLQVHGTADPRVPYGGGPGQAFSLDGKARVDGPAIPAVNATFRAANGCAPPRTTVTGTVTTSSAQCPGGREVRLVSLAGGGHDWPTSPYHATAEIWRFFAAHPR